MTVRKIVCGRFAIPKATDNQSIVVYIHQGVCFLWSILENSFEDAKVDATFPIPAVAALVGMSAKAGDHNIRILSQNFQHFLIVPD